MINYKILVKDSDGTNLGEIATFRNLKFEKRLNNYGQCSFEIPANDEKASDLIALRVYTVEIYRDSVLLWAGEQAIRQGDLDDKGGNWVTIICFDWLEQLNSRYTVAEQNYTYQNGSDIAWDLIDATQDDTDGDLGITQGTLEATTWREKTYTNQSIMDALINLANLIDGFDFEINNSKVFNIKNFIGIDRSDSIVLEYGVNVKRARITEDFSKPATRAIVLGQSADVADSVRNEREDSGQMALYGLREFSQSLMEKSEPTAFNALGDSILRKYGSPLTKVNLAIVRGMSPTIEDIALGDVIRVKVKTGVYNIDRSFRIFEWQVEYRTDNTEILSLTLGDFYTEEIS